jgi:hypothetical protein
MQADEVLAAYPWRGPSVPTSRTLNQPWSAVTAGSRFYAGNPTSAARTTRRSV